MAMPCVMRARVAAPASTSGARAHAGGRATRARVPASRVRPETGAKRDADGLSLRGASFPLPAVMAPDAATVEASHPRRGGMGRRFADEESLSTPGDDAAIRNFWYPVHFEAKLAKLHEGETFVLFGEKLSLRREKDITNAAKAVAPLWGVDDPERLDDSSTLDGVPSPRARAATPDAFVCESLDSPGRFLPIGVQDGLVMVWPGTCRPSASLPVTFRPPEGYTTHAELIIECVPVEHGLLMENLLDLAHAPFTHTGTFAKGWGVPNFVEFVSKQMRKPGDGWHDMANALANAGGKNAPVSVKKLIGMNGDLEGQQGSWNPYPIDMKFVTPCMVDSHIGMSQAGAAGGGAQFEEGVQCAECSNHLHQLHVCAPAAPGTTRLLYRMSLDFAGWAKYVPGIELVWTEMANQVLGEDLRLVTGQQDRMQRGGRVWAHPVAYDKLGLVYRRWRNFSVGDACPMPENDEN